MPNIHLIDSGAIIFDNGSGVCKAGFSGEKKPLHTLRSVVGYQEPGFCLPRDYCLGDDALRKHIAVRLHYPIEYGLVLGWDGMEKIWREFFECKLHVIPSEWPVLMTEPALNPRSIRQKIAEIMFETFNVPSFYLSNQSALSLYASSCLTGLVVESGYGITCTVPVFEGYPVRQGVTKLYIAGRDLTEYLAQLLQTTGYANSYIGDRGVVCDIKEKLCYVAFDREKEMKKKREEVQKGYSLPDGSVIYIGDHLYQVPEVLFEPRLLGLDNPGISKMVATSIFKCDFRMQRKLFAKIMLTGGNTMFPGMEERLLKELEQLSFKGAPIKIMASPDRIFSGWTGASIMTSLSTFKRRWVTSAEFKDFGPSIVQRKCL
ncbi:PREDICTED: actin-related protein T1-like [Elephantulus edwardii]|uniref:actin-related protein T1-like n=1 Tax=Elephantulus edwardii TaxID=28737 RepID=UPI0003F061E9|nr:PREDICTED: actin-related protein T1-like [Elephantulus edwardii]